MSEPINGRLALLDRVIEFSKYVGVPGVLTMCMLGLIGYVADRYLEHTIEMERQIQQHRIATERAQVEIMGHTFEDFAEAHRVQAEAVVGISKELRRQGSIIHENHQ